MGQVINRINSIFTGFIGHFLGLESGSFILTAGDHIIEVPTEQCACAVWMKFEGSRFDGCGQPAINKVGYALMPNSIIFDLNIRSETCEVFWFATY
jgi:hypothetical protein